jgi:hypothetical protein
MSVGEIKDQKLNLRNLHVSHVLDCSSNNPTNNPVTMFGELEHLKIKTRLIDEKFPSVMGEYAFLK